MISSCERHRQLPGGFLVTRQYPHGQRGPVYGLQGPSGDGHGQGDTDDGALVRRLQERNDDASPQEPEAHIVGGPGLVGSQTVGTSAPPDINADF